MTSLRFADEITHQLWNRNCLRLQIDSQTDSFKADRQTDRQTRRKVRGGQRDMLCHCSNGLPAFDWNPCVNIYCLYLHGFKVRLGRLNTCFESQFEMVEWMDVFSAGVAVNSRAGERRAPRRQAGVWRRRIWGKGRENLKGLGYRYWMRWWMALKSIWNWTRSH